MFYCIEIFIGLCFFILDINSYKSDEIKWLISFNHAIYAMIKHLNTKAILALSFAFIADYFLLFTNHYLIGIIFFILVQLTYMHLLNYHNYLPLIFTSLFIFNPLIIAAFIYLCFSIFNLVFSFKVSKSFFSAILLLLCCDITIALIYLNVISECFSIIIWLFYLPSQLCFIYSQRFL